MTFSNTVGAANALGALSINASSGSGTITFSSTIGDAGNAGTTGTTAIGNDTTGTINLNSTLYKFDGGTTTITTTSGENIELGATAATTIASAGESLTFATGTIDLSNGTDLTINSVGGAITIAGIAGDSDETVTISADDAIADGDVGDSTTETVSLGNVGDSDSTEIHNLTVTADEGITLTGAIYTSASAVVGSEAADIVFNDKVLVNGTVIIDSNDSANDGVITFSTSIDGVDGTGDDLTINSGTGTLTLQAIGATQALSTLNINTASTSTANISLPNIGDAGNDGVDGATNIGNSLTNQLTISGTIYKTGGATDYEAKSGNTILLTGVSPTITTGGADLSFSTGNLVLSSAGTTTFTTGSGSAGGITVAGTIDGTNGQNEALALESGSGAIQLQGTIGGTNPVTTLAINSTNGSAGTIEIVGIGDSDTTGASSTATIGNTSTGTLTLDGTIYKTGGNQTYVASATGNDSGQNIDITGAATFTTTNDAVAFNTSGVDLANDGTTTINTGTGIGAVSFAGALESNGGSNDLLVITSGEGDVTFTGAVGATNALGGLDVNSSAGDGDITFSSTIGDSGNAGVVGTTAIGGTATEDVNLAGLIYKFDGGTTITAADGDNIKLTGTGDVTFTTAADNIEFATGHIHLADGSNLVVDTGALLGNITIAEIAGTSQETVTLDAGTGTTSVGPIGSGTEIGDLSIGSDANGGITLNGAIVTDGTVLIDGPVTLATGAVSVTTANDTITFNHTINGTQTLTLESGSAAIKLDGAIGGTGILTGLSVNATDNSTGTIEISDIGDGDDAAGVNTGTISIGNANTATLTLDGTVYKTDGATIYESAAGDKILLTGADVTISTLNDNLTFDGGNVILSTAGTTTIDTELTGTGAGDILFDGTIDGTASQDEALVIKSGSGSIQLQGTIGGTNPVTTLGINSVNGAAGTIEIVGIAVSYTHLTLPTIYYV